MNVTVDDDAADRSPFDADPGERRRARWRASSTWLGKKYFDNTSCHRLVTPGIYVLQCGDPTGTGSGGPGYSSTDE